HDKAMDHATSETVLGDFSGAEIENFGVVSRMFQRDEKYWIHTEGPDGEMADFEIKYVFGFEPLQQYMVEFDRPADMPPHEVARLQVSRIAWDTLHKRWFYLPPPDVDEKLAPNDDLHWTGVAQRWNNMCADCHSTNLKKNYDVATKTYHTTYSEIDVSCEACHGPGSTHVELARAKSLFWDRKVGYGLPHLKSPDSHVEIETCVQCHSRRRLLHPEFQPGDDFYNNFANELLGQATYYVDGQIQDEVYVHGSFIQSKMYHRGIRCTDCHDPHTARLKHNGNQVCTSCHQHPAGKYDGPAHHHHKPESTGASCVECHMPETTYMEVDARRDHSLRVPRPDLSVDLGTPNACTRCHLEKADLPESRRAELPLYQDWLRAARDGDQQVQAALDHVNRWAAEKSKEWYGEKRDAKDHFAYALSAAREGDRESLPTLMRLATDRRQAGIVRATAASELGQFANEAAFVTSKELLEDDDPTVRAAAIANFQALPDDRRLLKTLAPLLDDPVRLVRTEAARVLARVPRALTNGAQRKALDRALEEFEAGLMMNNDRATAHMTLGILYEDQGRTDDAIAAYKTAIAVEPQVTGPRTNLAALYERLASAADEQARNAARQGDEQAGIAAAEQGYRYRQLAEPLAEQELENLKRDTLLAPDNAFIHFRYGLSLYRHGRFEQAEAELTKAANLEPNDEQIVYGVMRFHYDRQNWSAARPWAEQLLEVRPQEPAYRQLYEEIKARAGEAADN
ncbi:MAG: HEAT repeat domain-containing protein, partial [Planctomycetales bacterium]|nr:HEAT repeat domain-containing protein [Planctomycetales bacterium]